MQKYISLLVVGFLFFFGCTKQKNGGTDTGAAVTDTDYESTNIKGKVGDEFSIVLDSNPTTGYSWQLDDLETGIVEEVSQNYEQAQNTQGLVGAGGQETWIFTAVGAGKVTLHFKYVRPWESGIAPVETADYVITITE